MNTKSKKQRDKSEWKMSPRNESKPNQKQEKLGSRNSVTGRRSIREMVLENNRRFAATMRSLGE